MAINRKPTSPASRHYSKPTFEELTKGAVAPKSLLSENSRSGGRNAQGKITVRHIGGGNRRKYRIIEYRKSCGI